MTTMHIRVINYRAIGSPLVQAFVDIEVDNWLRLIGLNLMRDGSLRAAQLKTRSGTRDGWIHFPAVVIPDADLRELVVEEILIAIRAHIATLPLEKRVKPVHVPERREPAIKPAPAKQKPPLPPPVKLLAGARKVTRPPAA